MQALFHGLDHATGPTGGNTSPGAGPGGFPGLQQLFASVLNPANAAHGDVVYSQEALDRIISQFMEQHNGSSAPGPASAAAISALPTQNVNTDMLGSDGKAECSVCMDNVELGDEVTVLPCRHWFHGDCGIMPKDAPSEGEATSPRAPGQEPRNSQPPLSPGGHSGPGGFHSSRIFLFQGRGRSDEEVARADRVAGGMAEREVAEVGASAVQLEDG
ncbi:MAG: hypothetical protein Q9213_007005 [Squamulea squamosa]